MAMQLEYEKFRGGVSMLPLFSILKSRKFPQRKLAFSLSMLCLSAFAAGGVSAQNPQDIANIPVSPMPNAGPNMSNARVGQPGGNIQQWFQRYDQVRRQSQMTPAEKQRADGMMSKGMSGLGAMLAGDEKAATQNLLSKLVGKYQTAAEQMKSLPLFPETERLHRGYYQYFSEARRLFSDYLKVQGNLFAMDEETGKPVAAGLMARKQNLEILDMQNKTLDEQLRQQFGIAPYRY